MGADGRAGESSVGGELEGDESTRGAATDAALSPSSSTAGSLLAGTLTTRERLLDSSCRLDGPKRTAGLKNLGNTCFMNSSLQCVAHIPCVREYFLSDRYKESLVRNAKATEKTGGRLAKGFAELLRRLWNPDERAFEPRTFKALVEQFAENFGDRRQHDSMEFIEFLIDGLKEDCNNVKGKKPYVERQDANGRPDIVVALEASNSFLLRNDSEIDDLFVGFLKTVTTCPESKCGHESVVFDPFLSVKVPLASPTDSGEVTFHIASVPLPASGRPLERWRVSVAKYASVEDLVEVAAELAELRMENCALLKLNTGLDKLEEMHRRMLKLDNTDKVEDVLEPPDVLFLYELEDSASLRILEKRRWGMEDHPRRDDIVVVLEDFASNSKGRQPIRRGTLGHVCKVDRDGDALIRFDGIEARQWVFQNNFNKLRVDLSLDFEERRRTAENSELSLLELIEVDEDASLEELLYMWKEEMRSVDDIPCWVLVHFRRVDFKNHRNELFGVPLLVCVSRETSAEMLADAVRTEMAQRYGDVLGTQWRMLQAADWFGATNTRAVIWDEGRREGVEQLPAPPEYLVIEWRDAAPEEICRHAPLAEKSEDAAPEVTINRCFGWITEAEQLSEQDAVYCSGCKNHRRCFRRVDFWSLPPVLVLQLKRFEFTGLSGRKDTTPVHFPLEGLDLRRFCPKEAASFPSGSCLRAGRLATINGLKSAASQALNGREGMIMYLDTATTRFCVRLQEDDPSDQWKKIKPENLAPVECSAAQDDASASATCPPIYDLLSVSKHVGCSSFGHYVAYARSSEDGMWRLFDDDDVTEVLAEEVESQRQGAYVLFYLRRDQRPCSWGAAPTSLNETP